MISTYARLTPKPSCGAAVVQAAFIAASLSSEEVGCDSSIARRDGDVVVMRQEWASREAYQAHLDGPVAAQFLASVDGLLEEPPAADILDSTDF